VSEKLTTDLLRRAHNAAIKNKLLAAKISEAMEARYGTTHSAVDCEDLIEAIDYGAGSAPTLAYADEAMAACGYPPLKGEPANA
jgi:hypothetical protein